MSDYPSLDWGRADYASLLRRWPKDPRGEPEEPVFLCRRTSLDMSDELLINMLEAYQIPCLRRYPGDGGFGRVILGMSGEGVDIFVPKSLYEDAKILCEGEQEHEEL